MMIFRFVLLITCASMPGVSLASSSQSGVILPSTLESLPTVPGDGRPLVPFDANLSYASNGEAITVYITRSTVPNTALWFERADATLKLVWASRGLGAAGQVTNFVFGGSTTPNGMTRVYEMSGRSKSTALSVIQLGQWIMKIRSTSETLDVAGQTARMGRILSEIKMREPVKESNPLVMPENCSASSHSIFDTLGSEAIKKPKAKDIIMAGMVALLAAGDATGGAKSLAADPASFCKGTLTPNQDVAALYWSKDPANKGWTMLLADSGRSLSGVTLPILSGKKSEEGGILTANQLDKVEVLMLTKGSVPMPDASFMIGLNHIIRGGQVLTAVEYGTTTVNVNLPR